MNKIKIAALKMLAQSIGKTQRVVKKSTYSWEESAIEGEESDEDSGVTVRSTERVLVKTKKTEVENVNHYRGLKRAYKKGGEQGMINYIKEVRIYQAALLAKYGSSEAKASGLKELDGHLKSLIAGGASSFWKNLLAFIYSFFYSFIKEED